MEWLLLLFYGVVQIKVAQWNHSAVYNAKRLSNEADDLLLVVVSGIKHCTAPCLPSRTVLTNLATTHRILNIEEEKHSAGK
jgi:hypothetical protein